MALRFTTSYLTDSLDLFRYYKSLAEKAIAQVTDEQLLLTLDKEMNSIAVIVKHMAGNMRSRWTDFLTSDGEKPNRNRDTEFEMIGDTRESLMEFWERGWKTLFDSLEPLTAEDFSRTITIRGEPHTVVEAVNRQLTHYAYHIGQIVLLAKHFNSSDWKTLSVPKNKSAEFNKFLADKQSEGVAKTNRMEAPLEFGEGKK